MINERDLELIFFCLSIAALCMAIAICRPEYKVNRTFPMVVMGIMISMFLFGILAGIYPGFWITVALIIGICAGFTLFGIAKYHNSIKEVVRANRAYFIMMAICFSVIVWADYNTLGGLVTVDDFSHWMSVVKEMVLYGDFVTNPIAELGVKSYPPGLSLLQYFIECINIGHAFYEWQVFAGYHVLLLSMFFPLLDWNKDRKIYSIVKPLIYMIIPICFYQAYGMLQAEPILGVVLGATCANVLFSKEKDTLYWIFVTMSCFCMVIIKDSGGVVRFCSCGFISD